MDDNTVQTDSPSTGEESTNAASETVAEPTMAETIQSAVDKAMTGMEQRMKQSARDTARSEVSKSKSDEGVRALLKGYDPESGGNLDDYLTKAEEAQELKQYRDERVKTETQQNQSQQAAQLYRDHLTASGIAHDDSRLDWTTVEGWYKSIAVIKEAVKPAKPEVSGNDFVDTAQTTGTKSFSIPTKADDFGPWLAKLPYAVYKEHKAEIEAAHNSKQMK